MDDCCAPQDSAAADVARRFTLVPSEIYPAAPDPDTAALWEHQEQAITFAWTALLDTFDTLSDEVQMQFLQRFVDLWDTCTTPEQVTAAFRAASAKHHGQHEGPSAVRAG